MDKLGSGIPLGAKRARFKDAGTIYEVAQTMRCSSYAGNACQEAHRCNGVLVKLCGFGYHDWMCSWAFVPVEHENTGVEDDV